MKQAAKEVGENKVNAVISPFASVVNIFYAILVAAHLYFSRCAMRERARASERTHGDRSTQASRSAKGEFCSAGK